MYEALYVNNFDVEEKLTAISDGPMNQSIAFTGNTGSGKSTTLRYLFGDNRNPSIRDSSQIVIPFFIDGIRTEIADIEETIVSQILVASDIIIEEHGVQIDDVKLVEFIAQNKRSLIRGRGIPKNAKPSEIISHLEEHKPYAHAAERLKFACEFSNNIDRVLLIVDDIESAPHDRQQAIIKAILSFKNCLHNTRNEARTFKSAFIFSCRPATYEMIRHDTQVNGFPQRKQIFLARTAKLDDILQCRFNFAIKMLGEGKIGNIDPTLSDAKDIQKWREAFSTFGGVMSDISGNFGHLILEMANNNIRQAMAEIQNMLEHSSWFERDGHVGGAFNVRENEYRTTHVGVFRAMVLQDRACFSYQADTLLVNPFFNFSDPEGDLMGCHIFKLFFQQAKQRRVVLLEEKRLKEKLEICFPDRVVDDHFDEILNYFAGEEAIRFEDHNGNKVVIPQNKLFTIYKTLVQTSVFLEFFFDATYQRRNAVEKYSMKYHRGLSRIPADKQFLALFDFVEQVIEAERDIFERVRRRGFVEIYDKNFGPQLISKRVLDGLIKNCHLYYNTGRNVKELPDELSKRMIEIRTYLRASKLLR